MVSRESAKGQDSKQSPSKNVTDPVEYLYDIASSNPSVWRASACQFKRTANLALRQIDEDDKDRRSVSTKPISLDSMYPYLMGVAVENLLKGILIAHKKPFDEVIGFDHNLVDLYNECNHCCGLTARKDERKVLEILTVYDKWAGRFNLPKREEDLSDVFEKCGLRVQRGGIITPLLSRNASNEDKLVPTERKKMETLYQRLLNHLEGIICSSDNPHLFPCE